MNATCNFPNVIKEYKNAPTGKNAIGYVRKSGKLHIKRNHTQPVTHEMLQPEVGIVCCVHVYIFTAGIGISVCGWRLDTICCGQMQ